MPFSSFLPGNHAIRTDTETILLTETAARSVFFSSSFCSCRNYNIASAHPLLRYTEDAVPSDPASMQKKTCPYIRHVLTVKSCYFTPVIVTPSIDVTAGIRAESYCFSSSDIWKPPNSSFTLPETEPPDTGMVLPS